MVAHHLPANAVRPGEIRDTVNEAVREKAVPQTGQQQTHVLLQKLPSRRTETGKPNKEPKEKLSPSQLGSVEPRGS